MNNIVDGAGRKVCAYCGAVSPETRDHIPPRNLFPKPRPADFLTVPCCKRCQKNWSKDDEYFRVALLSARNLSDVSTVQPVVESILSSLQRPQARGLAKLVESSLIEVEQRTEAGIIVGTVPAFKVQQPRLERVGGRIIRALFFEEFGQPLPNTHVAKASIQQFGLDKVWPLLKQIQFAQLRSIAANSFKYTFSVTQEDPFSSVWLLDFFDCVPMVGFTLTNLHNQIRHAD